MKKWKSLKKKNQKKFLKKEFSKMVENQKTISEWANSTFGPVTDYRAVRRMVEEVQELVEVCECNDINDMDKVSNECADILVTLYQVANTFGFDLHACVDHKMQINRARKWKIAGDGTGQHVKE